MDTSKAFDMVDHDDLMVTLHNQGVVGPLWNLYDSAYSNIKSIVKWQGQTSREIEEDQGIRQGGLTSADAFNGKSDPMLNVTSDQAEGFKIGTTNVGAIMVADDLALSSNSKQGLQLLINFAEHDASTKRYVFSTTKTKIQATNTKEKPNITLNDAPIETSNEEAHLGILRRSDLSNRSTIEARIQTGRRTIFMLMGAGVYGLNGVCPSTSKKLIDIYVMPRMTYGLECLTLSSGHFQPLEIYYRELLKDIQHLPTATANPACYLLIGAIPVEAHVHIKTLTLFGSIMRREDSLEYEVFERQLAVKDNSSNSWAIHVKKLLSKYNLPRPIQLLYSMSSKEQWKRCVKHHVITYWMDELRETAKGMSTMSYINMDSCQYNSPHPVWELGTTDPLIVHRAAVHTKLLVQRYPINTSHTSRTKAKTCPCCESLDETLQHFILECPMLARTRSQLLPRIIATLKSVNIRTDPGRLLQAIMDISKLTLDQKTIAQVTTMSRNLCFNLHLTRLDSCKDPNRPEKPHAVRSGAIKRRRTILTYREPTRVRPQMDGT